MKAFTFHDEPPTEARPNGHSSGSEPTEWPEPIDILADPSPGLRFFETPLCR